MLVCWLRRLLSVFVVSLAVVLFVVPLVGVAADSAAADADDVAAYARAQALFAERKFAKVMAALDTLLAVRPRDARALVLRGNAEADCEKALSIDPKSRRGLWARGRLALVEKRYTDGIADLNAYIAQYPKSSDTAYYFRGLVP